MKKEIVKKTHKKHNIKKSIVNMFFTFMAFIYIYIMLNAVFNNETVPVKLNPIVMLLLCVGYIIIIYFVYKLLKKIKNDKLFITISFSILILVQLLFAYLFAVNPSWDFGTVFESAVNKAIGRANINQNPYFYYHSNNIGITLLLGTYYKFFNFLNITNWNTLGILLNLVLIDVSIIYLYKTAKLYFNREQCRFFLILTMIFTPFITYVPIYYTDTLSMPFGIAGIYYFLKYKDSEDKKILFLLFSGVLLGIGMIIKSTIITIFIAIIIYLIFKEKPIKLKVMLKQILLVGIGLLIMFSSLKTYITLNFDAKLLDKLSFPKTHYIMMGLKNYGGYDTADQDYTGKFEGKKNKEIANIKIIKKRISKMVKENELLKFYTNKLVYTWGDGTFFAPFKLERQPKKDLEIKNYILFNNNNNNKNIIYQAIAKIQGILMLFFIAIGMILQRYLNDKQKELLLLVNVSIFGLLLLLLIWETRSRYIVNFIPLLLLSSYLGITAVTKFIKEKTLKTGEIRNEKNKITEKK